MATRLLNSALTNLRKGPQNIASWRGALAVTTVDLTASFSSTSALSGKKELEVINWLQSDKCPVKDLDTKTAEGIVTALKRSPGLSMSVSSARMLGKSGLASLAETVRAQQAKNEGKEKVSVTINVPHERHRFIAEGYDGDTLQDLVETSEDLARYFECACGGNAACSTCHVIVDEKSFMLLPPATNAEEDMLDHAYGLSPTSRLGCQLILTPSINEMVLTVPDGVNNMY